MKALSYAVTLLFAFYILNPVVIGQDQEHKASAKHKEYSFCGGDSWPGADKVLVKDVRESTFAASGSLNVDGGRNGGVSVKGENRSDVLVRACVQAWGSTEAEAKAIVSGIRIETGSTIKAESSSDENWSVSYQISAPRNTNLSLTAHNGGISIKSVDGNIDFTTTNGGVNLGDLSGSVKGRTTNGGVTVSLTGNSWRGSGMEVVTTNGGVNLTVPDGYAAQFETGTTNGGFKSDVAALTVQTEDDKGGWQRSKRVVASMNGGGAPIKVVTTNGGIRIGSNTNE
ncbi:MAG: DUF4097 family beta strand repeat-containing protein [bacterium]|nr:DUF4097 family beta strand repeat-containing protein [bacterium]